jgi:hypothetical protein
VLLDAYWSAFAAELAVAPPRTVLALRSYRPPWEVRTAADADLGAAIEAHARRTRGVSASALPPVLLVGGAPSSSSAAAAATGGGVGSIAGLGARGERFAEATSGGVGLPGA